MAQELSEIMLTSLLAESGHMCSVRQSPPAPALSHSSCPVTTGFAQAYKAVQGLEDFSFSNQRNAELY